MIGCLSLASETQAQCRADFSYSSSGSGVFVFADSTGSRYTTDKWDLGDGNTYSKTTTQFTHTYKPGTYKVCRMVWDSLKSCRDTFCATVTYSAKTCKALFSYKVSSDSVLFTNTSTNGVYLSWDFGDGASSGATNPLHIYKKSNTTYTVCLTIYDSLRTCTDKYCAYVRTAGSTTSKCDASFSSQTSGTSTVFVANSRTATKYTWLFGDGNTSNSTVSTHTYKSTASGNDTTYQACLIVEDSVNKCSDTVCKSIVVKSSSGSGCNASFTTTQGNTYVVFRANTTGSSKGISYTWDYGDSSTGTSATTTHLYTVPKGFKVYTYQACLTVYDSSTRCSETNCKAIVVYKDTCAASFTATKRGLIASFNNTSSYSKTTKYLWDFGDGDTMSASHPTHNYTKPGTYYVCLSVTDTANSCNTKFCDSIVVDTSSTTPSCKADFDIKVTNDTLIELTNKSTGGTSYAWSYLGSGRATSKNLNFVVKKAGQYDVCLSIYDSITGCFDSTCKVVIIQSAKKCRAAFRVAIDTSQAFKLFLLNGSSNYSSHQYKWSFGDGGTSTKRNPSHKYTSNGLFNVCLTITDSTLNCTSVYCDSIGLDSNGKLLKLEGFELEVIEDFSNVKNATKIESKLYPNPFNTEFTVELESSFNESARVRVLNLQGKLVAEKTPTLEGRVTFDMKNETDGMYIIQIFDGKSTSQTKLLKMSK